MTLDKEKACTDHGACRVIYDGDSCPVCAHEKNRIVTEDGAWRKVFADASLCAHQVGVAMLGLLLNENANIGLPRGPDLKPRASALALLGQLDTAAQKFKDIMMQGSSNLYLPQR